MQMEVSKIGISPNECSILGNMMNIDDLEVTPISSNFHIDLFENIHTGYVEHR